MFGFTDITHSIDNGLINVTLSVNVSQAALICMACQLSVSNSQLIFIANGQVLSAAALNVLVKLSLINSSVEYRFQSL